MKYLFITLFIFTIFSTNSISIAGSAKEDGQNDLWETITTIRNALNGSYEREMNNYEKFSKKKELEKNYIENLNKEDLEEYKEWYSQKFFGGEFSFLNIDDLVRYVDAIVIRTYGENKTEEYIKNKTNKTEEYIKNKTNKRKWDIDDLSQYLEDTLKAQNIGLKSQRGSEAKPKIISSFGQTTKILTAGVLGETTQTKSETASSTVDTKNKSNISKFNISKFENATYLGEFKKQKKKQKTNIAHGYGIFIFLDGSVYEGKVSKNRIHGNGRYIDAQGNVFEGKFRRNKFIDKIDKKIRKIITLDVYKGIGFTYQIKGDGRTSGKWFEAEMIYLHKKMLKNNININDIDNNSELLLEYVKYVLTSKGKRDMEKAISEAGDSGGDGGGDGGGGCG